MSLFILDDLGRQNISTINCFDFSIVHDQPETNASLKMFSWNYNFTKLRVDIEILLETVDFNKFNLRQQLGIAWVNCQEEKQLTRKIMLPTSYTIVSMHGDMH